MLAHGHQARVPSAKWIQTWDHSSRLMSVIPDCSARRLPDHYLPTYNPPAAGRLLPLPTYLGAPGSRSRRKLPSYLAHPTV